jgi:hypothetical protein
LGGDLKMSGEAASGMPLLIQDRLDDVRLLRAIGRSLWSSGRGKELGRPLVSSAKKSVEIAWNIHLACNFDCTYCFYHGYWEDLANDNRYLPPAEWARHWKRFNDRHGGAEINIVGGEPFTYPGFMEILENLAVRNHLYVTTNLSWAPEPFISRLAPESVGIYASFHPEYFKNPAPFIDKILRLRGAGFEVTAGIVAYPPLLDKIPQYTASFRSSGIRLLLQPFRGNLAGREYPRSYTALAKAYVDWRIGDEYGEWAPLVRKYQLEQAPTLGLHCNSGVTYARLQTTGLVTRCAVGGPIGNFFDEDFRLWKEPTPCPFELCACVNEVLYLEGCPRGPAGRTPDKRSSPGSTTSAV